jgi:RecA-family ATPase
MTPATTSASNPLPQYPHYVISRPAPDVHADPPEEVDFWNRTIAAWTADREALKASGEMPTDDEWLEMSDDEKKYFAINGKKLATYSPWDYALKPLAGQPYSGWFPRGRFAIVAGASGAMKTTTLIQALVSARDGKPFLGHEGSRMSFCFLFADRGKWDVEETLARMGFQGRVPYRCINGVTREEALKAITEEAKKHTVIVIDGGDLLVEDNNDGTSVAAFTTELQKIAQHFGTSMIVTTGAGKMTGKMLKEGGERRAIVKGSEV